MATFSKKGDETRERILDAAVQVLSKKGYSGAGVREIAREADVNLAMISYYFDNKAGLFKAIVNRFFDRYGKAILPVMADQSGTPRERVRRGLRAAMEVLRTYSDEVRVAVLELPLEIHDLKDLKAERIRTLVFPVLAALIESLVPHMRRELRLEMIAPTVGGILMFHFVMRPVIEKVFDSQFDDKYYDDFADELTQLLMYGLLGTPDSELGAEHLTAELGTEHHTAEYDPEEDQS